MPRIPDQTALGAPDSLYVRTQVPNASDVDASAIGRGIQSVAQGVGAVGNAIDQNQQKQDAIQLLQADVAHKQSLNDLQRSFESDSDYPTQQQRFINQANDTTGNIAGTISNPEARKQWALRAQLDNQQNGFAVGRTADSMVQQKQVVALQDTLDGYRDQFLDPKATDDVRAARLTDLGHAIDIGEHSRILTPDQANKLRVQYLNEMPKETATNPVTANRVLGTQTLSPDVREVPMQAPAGKAVGDQLVPNQQPPTPQQPSASQADSSKSQVEAIANVSTHLETGRDDPLQGVSNISRDTNGSKSYGNFGLNSQSGSSAWQFRKNYGESLGLTANPGTPQFDRQWRSVAQNDPQKLRDAEVDWYSENILPRVSRDLQTAGIPKDIASDPRVIAYFADRSVQQGPNSIVNQKHAARIGEAFDNSEGDAVSFLKQMSAADKSQSALQSDFPHALQSGVYSAEGNNTRVNGREQAALSINDQGGAEQGQAGQAGAGQQQQAPSSSDVKLPPWLDHLSPLEKQQWIAQAHQTLEKDNSEKAAELSSQVKNDVERIRDTGQPQIGPDGRTTLDYAKNVLKPREYENLRFEWNKAQLEHYAVSPLDNMSEDQARDHIASLAAKSDDSTESYKAIKYARDKAEKRLDDVISGRVKDSADSVDSSTEVQNFRASIQNPTVRQFDGSMAPGPKPSGLEAMDGLIKARLAAQDRLDISPDMQHIVTRDEAARLLQLGGDPKNLPTREFMRRIDAGMTRAQQIYGPDYAERAFAESVDYMVKNKNERTIASQLAARALSGGSIGPSDVRNLQNERAMSPFGNAVDTLNARPDTTVAPSVAVNDLPKPNQNQIEYLKQNPDKWPIFDRQFGGGTSARVLGFQPNKSLPPAQHVPTWVERNFGSAQSNTATPAHEAEFRSARVATPQQGGIPHSMDASLQ